MRTAVGANKTFGCCDDIPGEKFSRLLHVFIISFIVMLCRIKTLLLVAVGSGAIPHEGSLLNAVAGDDRVLSVLLPSDGSGLYRTSISLISSFLDSSQAMKSLSSAHYGALTGSSESNRRRGGHAPCECPEENDVLTTQCLDRRYDTLGLLLHKSQTIERNSTSLRKQYENLLSSTSQIDQSTEDANFVLNVGNSSRPSLVGLTSKQVRVVRELTDALVRCVSSIWVHEFDLYSMSENEFGRLNELVRNATEAILTWFSRMQANEESTNLQNLLIRREWAVSQIDSNVKDINKVVSKTYKYLSALEGQYGETYRGGDALQQSLENGADREEEKIDTFIRSIESTLTNAKYNIEVELKSRVTNDLVKYAAKMVTKLQELASGKLKQTRDASSKQIAQQSDTAMSVLFARVRNESTSMISTVEANLDNHRDSIETLQAKLNGAIDSVLVATMNSIKNDTTNRRWTLDSLMRLTELTQSDLNSFKVDKNRAESEMRSTISKLNAGLESELSNIVSSVLNTKSASVLGSASAESSQRIMQVEDDVHNKKLQVKRAMQNSMDYLGSSSHGAARDSIRTTGDLKKLMVLSQEAMSSAADRITNERNIALGNMLTSVSDSIGMPMAQLGSLNKEAALSALNQYKVRAKDDIRLYNSKSNEAGTLAASNANGAVTTFLQYLGATTRSVQDSKASISTSIDDLAHANRASPTLLDAYMRRQMSGSFSGLADSEDAARARFAKLMDSIPLEMDRNMQSSLQQGGQRMIQGLLTSDATDVGRMRDQLIDIAGQHRSGMSSGIDAIAQADGRVKFLGQQFDALSARRLADQQHVLPLGLSGIYSAAADESTGIVRAEQKTRHKIEGMKEVSLIAIDRTALGALEKYRSDIDNHESYANSLKRFADSASPGLERASSELQGHRDKMDRFFEQSRRDVAEAVRTARTNTSQVWDTLLTELTERLSHRNRSSNEVLDAILTQAMSLADSVPADTNQTIQRIYEAFMNGEDVMKYQLNDIAVTAFNVSNGDDSKLDQSEIGMTDRVSAIFDNLHDVLGNRTSIMSNMAGNGPLPVPFQLAADRFMAQKMLKMHARQLVGQQNSKMQRTLYEEVGNINKTLNELAIQTARAGMKSTLDASSMGGMMSSTNQYLEKFFSDSNVVVNDYGNELEIQKNKNQISAEMLYDKVVQVKATAANMMGHIAEQLVRNREDAISDSTTDPKMMTAIVRSQVTALAQLFDIFSRGTGLQGLLRVAIDTSQDAGATILHVVETRHAALEHDVGSALDEIRRNENEVNARISDFQAAADDIESQATDFRHDIDLWKNSTMISLNASRDIVQSWDFSEPNIATLLVSSVSNLVQNIESSLRHSLSPEASNRLNSSMNEYMRNFSLSMAS